MFKTLDEARLAMIEQRLERYRQCRLNSPTSHTNEQLVKHHAMRLAEDDVPWLIDRVRALNNQSIDDAEIGDALANVLGNFVRCGLLEQRPNAVKAALEWVARWRERRDARKVGL
jgi:hypothetical protein